MLEHTEIGRIFTKIGDAKPQSLKEQILLLDCYALQYDLVTEIRRLRTIWEQMIKLQHAIIPDEDTEDWWFFHKLPVRSIQFLPVLRFFVC